MVPHGDVSRRTSVKEGHCLERLRGEMPTVLTTHPSKRDQVCLLSSRCPFYAYALLSITRLQLLLDSHKAHGPPLGQAILYISPVDVLALY